jgi:hypothetical protein
MKLSSNCFSLYREAISNYELIIQFDVPLL